MDHPIKLDTLKVKYTGPALSDPFIELYNFEIENLVNHVPNDYVQIRPKGLSHRVYDSEYPYIIGDPSFYIDPPLNDSGSYDNNFIFLYELPTESTTIQSIENIRILPNGSEIFERGCIEGQCYLYIKLHICLKPGRIRTHENRNPNGSLFSM